MKLVICILLILEALPFDLEEVTFRAKFDLSLEKKGN